jgi:3D (Asp-Asp-Asp) domain-containing protein
MQAAHAGAGEMQMPERTLGAVKRRLRMRRLALEGGTFAFAAVLTAASAVWVKEGHGAPPLAAVSVDRSVLIYVANPTRPEPFRANAAMADAAISASDIGDPNGASTANDAASMDPLEILGDVFREDTENMTPAASDEPAIDPETRWFNGRPVRPVRKIWMTITAYSPDEASCGDSADGITATLHDVTTNASRLVAADPRILKYGSLLSIQGYDDGLIVPVLDCGGKIKGHRLDVLFPTHEQARAWGVRRMQVTLWGYADGKPADDPRKLRQ